MHHTIVQLIECATHGSAPALAALISIAIDRKNFLSRRAREALRDHFRIETT